MAYTNIDDPSAYFHTQLYTGNGTAIGSGGNVITNNANSGNFKPDWTWHKVRSTANDHQVYDSSRGVKIRLNPNATNSDFTLNEGLQSFDTNGFTVGSDGGVNSNSQTYVAWQWKANGGTTASNSVGNISSTVQANTDAGFAIVTYTGNGSANQTIGHGLGAVPKMILFKNRSNAAYWYVYHVATGNDTMTYLNLNNAAQSLSSQFSTPTTTTFNVSNENSTFSGYNTSGNTYVAYVFADVPGYSKFGKYVGNGNANGPFVYTGFKPAFIMCKRSDSTGGWTINDNKRLGYNPKNEDLFAHLADAETSDVRYDLLSNGFKVRTNNAVNNTSGGSYIYMAFAEHPFVTSTGIPATAR